MTAGKIYTPTSWQLGDWNNQRTSDGLGNAGGVNLDVQNWIQPSQGANDTRFYVALRDPDLWRYKDSVSSLRSVKLFLKSGISPDNATQPGGIVVRGVIAGGDTSVDLWRGYQQLPRDLDWTSQFLSQASAAYTLQQKYQESATYGSYVTGGQARFTQDSVALDSKDNVGGDGVPFADGYMYDLTSMMEEMLHAPERAAMTDSSFGGYYDLDPDESKYWFLFTGQALQRAEYPAGFSPTFGKKHYYVGPYFNVVSPRNFDLGLYGLMSLEASAECHPSHPSKGIGAPDELDANSEKAWYSPPVWEGVDTNGDGGVSIEKKSQDLSDFVGREGEGSRDLESDPESKVWEGSVTTTYDPSSGNSQGGEFTYNADPSISYADGVPRIGINKHHYQSFSRPVQSPLGPEGKELTVSFWAKHDVIAGQAAGSFPYQQITKGKTYPVFGSRRLDPSKPIYDEDPLGYDGFAYGFEIRIGISASNRPIVQVLWQDRYHWQGYGMYRGGRSNQLGTYGTAYNYWTCQGESSHFDPTGDGYNHYLVTLTHSGGYQETTEQTSPTFWKCWVNGVRAGNDSSDFGLNRLESGSLNRYYWQPQVLTYTRSRLSDNFTDDELNSFNGGHGTHMAEIWKLGHVNYHESRSESFSGLIDDARLYASSITNEKQIGVLASSKLASRRIVEIDGESLEAKPEASGLDVVMRNLMMREGGSESNAENSEAALSISNYAATDSADAFSSCQQVDVSVPATSDSAESLSEYSVVGLGYSALAVPVSLESATESLNSKVDISGAASPDVVESRSQCLAVSIVVDRTLEGIGGETCWISPSRDNDNEDTSVTENFVSLQENIQVQSGQWLDDSVDGGDHSFEIGKSSTQSQGRVQLPGGIF